MPLERKALQQALQESQLTLCAEARRAGAAEALLRERTATLAAVSRRRTSHDGSKQGGPARLRSCSSSSSTVGSDLQVELQCALSVRDRLAEKLANAEREVAQLRHSEALCKTSADKSVKEVEELRDKIDRSEHKALEVQQEMQGLLVERDQLASSLAEGAVARLAQQNQLVDLAEKVETLQGQLTASQEQLETAGEQARRLSKENQELAVTLHSFKENSGTSDSSQLQTIARLEVVVDTLSKQMQSTELDLGAEQGTTAELQTLNKSLKMQLARAEVQRIALHNAIQELKGNIRVYCRVRPTAEEDEKSLALYSHEPNKLVLSHGTDNYGFTFDKVFGTSADQPEIFDEVSGLVQSALDGYKVCIFAYGQTGSGKTYTMQGTEDKGCAGLIPRALITIFEATEEMRRQGWSWSVKVSFMEVYNETLRDLLRGSGDAAAGPTSSPNIGMADGHVIAQHEAWGTMVTGMTVIEVDSVQKINTLMARAAKQRAVGATDLNATSSRSHSIFALYLRGTNHLANTEIHGALHLVDLAGSERLDKSGSTGERLKETQNINRSLSSLADVFAAKAEGRSHVPFRNSKLTHLMEPCLSGQGKTLMLVSVQPEQRHAHETLCSLRFARQVSQCNTGGKPRQSVKSLQPSPLGPRSAMAISPRGMSPRSMSSPKEKMQVSPRPLPPGPGGHSPSLSHRPKVVRHSAP